MSNDEGLPAPANSGRIPVVSLMHGVFGAALWIVVIWAVYSGLPRFKKTTEDFGTQIGPPAVIVLKYADLGLRVIGITAGASMASSRSLIVWRFILFYIPLTLIAVLAFAVGPSVVKLLNDLDYFETVKVWARPVGILVALVVLFGLAVIITGRKGPAH